MRFSSKSGQNSGIHMFSGAFLEKYVSHIKPSEVSFIRRDISCSRQIGGIRGIGKDKGV